MTFRLKNMVRRLLAGHAVLLVIAITVLAGCTVQPVRPESTPQGETQSDATTSPSADSPAETKTGAADASPTPDSGSGGTGKGEGAFHTQVITTAESIQLAYSMGGMSIKIAETSVDNATYTSGTAADFDATTVALTLAF